MIHDLELDRVRHPLLEELLADVPERAQERREGVDRELGARQEDDRPAGSSVSGPNVIVGDNAGSARTGIARTTASIRSLAM